MTAPTLWLTTALAATLTLAVPALAQQAPAAAPVAVPPAAPAAEPGTAPAAAPADAAPMPAGTGPAGASDDDGGDDQDDDDDGVAAPAASAAPTPTVQHHDYGPSGIMTRTNREDLAPLTLGSGKPVSDQEYDLRSGGYYRIDINADGSQELALSGGDFFRAVWVNEIVINDIEIRPMGVHSIEFDDEGTASMSFVAIMPGRYTLSVPGSSGETQQAVFNIR